MNWNQFASKSLSVGLLAVFCFSCSDAPSISEGTSSKAVNSGSLEDEPGGSVEKPNSSLTFSLIHTDEETPEFVVTKPGKNKDYNRSVFSEVNLNIKRIEVRMNHPEKGKRARLIIGQDIGIVNFVDSIEATNTILSQLRAPKGLVITDLRVVLNPEGHSARTVEGQSCELKTPSAAQSGLKIRLSKAITIDDGYDYSLAIGFNAQKSVITTGNGKCILKPVLRVPICLRESQSPSDEDESSEPVTDGDDSSDEGSTESESTDESSDESTGDSSGDQSPEPEEPLTEEQFEGYW